MNQPARIIAEPSAPTMTNLQPPPIQKTSKIPIILLLVLIIGIVSGAAFGLGKSSGGPKIAAKPNLNAVPTISEQAANSTADWKTYESLNKTVSFKYPNGLFSSGIFDDKRSNLYDGLISGGVFFYMGNNQIIDLEECRKKEKLPANGQKADVPEFESSCLNLWIIGVFVKIFPKGEIVVPRTRKITSYVDNNSREWFISENAVFSGSINEENSDIIYQSIAYSYPSNMTYQYPELQKEYYEVDITSRHKMLDAYLGGNKLPSTEKFENYSDPIPEHKELVRQILSTFKFLK